ncbi:MAG TPA: hypothetical protein VHG89_13845 [Verrucomicrobiae bacterium]|nr:hypothetical protein [Verrucomicrobiae bacterium]
MKKTIRQVPTVVIAGFLFFSFRGAAQTVQYVTLVPPGDNSNATFAVQTNQIVTLVGYDWRNQPALTVTFASGSSQAVTPNYVGSSNVPWPMPQTFAGLTSISVHAGNYATFASFQITTPASANVVSNYVPADAIVIPASATGNVQIILESSSDLVNWTAANPGTYGASSATNRFFRVRAVCN